MDPEAEFKRISNPYIVGNPIKSGEMFYGRQEEFFFTKRKIETGDKNYVIVFCGERRSGKTSILFQILSGKLGEAFLPVLIDMQTMAGLHNDGDFFGEIAQEICRTLKDSRVDLQDYTTRTLSEGPYKSFRALLDKVFALYPRKHLILMIDEYEMIEEKFNEGSLSPDVITFFAGLLESSCSVSFIFTGSRHLEQRQKIEFWRVLFGKSLYRRISFLSHEDTLRLIAEPVREVVAFDDGTVEAIYRLTAGQPFYTQVVCQSLIDHLNEVKKNRVEASDIEAVTEDILRNPLPQMIYIWNSLADMERLVMSVLAELQHQTEAFIPVAKLLRFLKEKDSGFAANKKVLITTLENLYERELVSKKEDAYRIPIELLSRWIRQEQSFWKIIHEMTPTVTVPQVGEISKHRMVKLGYALGGAVVVALGIFVATNILSKKEINPPSPTTETLATNLTSPAPLPEDLKITAADSNPAVAVTEKPVAPPKSEIREEVKKPPDLPARVMPGAIIVTWQPNAANLFFNDKLVDTESPAILDTLQAGEHLLRLEKAGYLSQEIKIVLAAGERKPVEIFLRKVPPAYLDIRVVPFADIYIDGDFKAKTSYFFTEVEPGRHVIKLAHASFGDTTWTIAAGSADTSRLIHNFLLKN